MIINQQTRHNISARRIIKLFKLLSEFSRISMMLTNSLSNLRITWNIKNAPLNQNSLIRNIEMKVLEIMVYTFNDRELNLFGDNIY